MVTRTEWYKRVNSTWPAGPLPALTEVEAKRAAVKLYRFALGIMPQGVAITTGNRYTWLHHGIIRVNAGNGWHRMVHDLSHWCNQVYQRDNPEARGHGADHARMEIRMIKEVLKRGWLTGSLKDSDKPAKPKPDPKVARYERILKRRAIWETKQQRAERALKKLARQARYYERTLAQ